jgi:hypothetical protein
MTNMKSGKRMNSGTRILGIRAMLPVLTVSVSVMVTAAPASAASRINTPNASCVGIQTALVDGGAAILRFASPRKNGLTLYDRYVGDSGFCPHGQYGEWASVPAKDTPRCRVIACKAQEPDDYFPHSPFIKPHLTLRVGS